MQSAARFSVRNNLRLLQRPPRSLQRGVRLAEHVHTSNVLHVRNAGSVIALIDPRTHCVSSSTCLRSRFEFLRELMQPQSQAAKTVTDTATSQQESRPAEAETAADSKPSASSGTSPSVDSEPAATTTVAATDSTASAEAHAAAITASAKRVPSKYAIISSRNALIRQQQPHQAQTEDSAEPDLSSLSLSHWRPSRNSVPRIIDLQSAQAALLNPAAALGPRNKPAAAASAKKSAKRTAAATKVSAEAPRMKSAAASKLSLLRSKRAAQAIGQPIVGARDPEEDEAHSLQQPAPRVTATAATANAANDANPAVEDEHGVSSSGEFVTISARMLETLQVERCCHSN